MRCLLSTLSSQSSAGSPFGLQCALSGIQIGGKEHNGDIFGTQGQYTEGIIYMARRFRMDNESLGALQDKMKKASMAVTVARAMARKRADGIMDEEAGECNSAAPPKHLCRCDVCMRRYGLLPA